MAHKLPPVLERGLRGMGMEMKEKAYSKKKVVKSIWDMDETNSAAAAPAPSIPDDLKCPICGDLFKVRRNSGTLFPAKYTPVGPVEILNEKDERIANPETIQILIHHY